MDRLENFETALKDVIKEYEDLGIKLKELRSAGQMKTTKFRELLGRKMVYRMIITTFEKHNLIDKITD